MKTKFVLITAAYNEEKFISQTMDSVISQTIRPLKWIIADDGSTDATGTIVKDRRAEHDFIIHYPLERRNVINYYFHRAEVFMSAFAKIKHLVFDFVAALDADLLLGSNYYESILTEFDRNPRLGIAAGVYVNKINGRLEKAVRDESSTPGGLQMFRRSCFETVGGYTPLKYGADDTLAEILARMNGYQTRSFTSYEVIHQRPTGTGAAKGITAARFNQGLAEYTLGTHPLFMLAKSVRRCFVEKPLVAGSAARLCGFAAGWLMREQRQIQQDAMSFVRREQIGRLAKAILRVVPAKRKPGI